MRPELIVALDVAAEAEAKGLIDRLYPAVKIFKVGSQLFTACGPDVIKYIRRKGADVFLDLKFHDIPNTVAAAVAAALRLDIFMLTLHACGGAEMMKRAKEAAGSGLGETNKREPKLVAVTVLTSDGAAEDTQKLVVERALAAKTSGLDGVVCSVSEAAAVRKACGEKFIIVTPGIRPSGGNKDDQKRVATPAAALAAGSDFLVVGRPILETADPLSAAQQILKEIGNK